MKKILFHSSDNRLKLDIYVNLLWSLRLDWKTTKSHYNNRVSFYKAPTKNEIDRCILIAITTFKNTKSNSSLDQDVRFVSRFSTRTYENKTGTSQVGAISKAQKAQNIFFWKKLEIFEKKFFRKMSHSAEKCKRGDPF